MKSQKRSNELLHRMTYSLRLRPRGEQAVVEAARGLDNAADPQHWTKYDGQYGVERL
jgi:hypothetical protein